MVSAWSIPQAKRSSLGNNENVPGPGEYKVEKQVKVVQNQSPQYSIGQSARSDLRNNEAPSPGTYKLPSLLGNDGPKYHIGEKRNIDWEEKEKQKLPGPASYSPQDMQKKAPAYTIPGRDRSESPTGKNQTHNKSVDSPGPGYYETNRTTLNGQSIAKMGNQKRTDLIQNKDIPGPGKYNISQSSLEFQRKSPQFSIGNQDRSTLDGGKTAPGVGTYNLNKTMLSSKGGFMGKRADQEKRDLSPGVGSYNLNELLNGKIKFGTIGKDLRKDLGNNNSPGPSHYEILGSEKFKQKNTPKFTIGSSKRIPLGGSEAPGPQHYMAKDSWNSNRGATIAARYYQDNSSDVPGPQSYHPDYNSILSKKAAYSTARSTREGIVNLKEKSKIPGPADYRNYEHQKFKTPKFSFGRSQRSGTDLSNTPGPGQYNLPPKFADVPKYLMPNKPNIF